MATLKPTGEPFQCATERKDGATYCARPVDCGAMQTSRYFFFCLRNATDCAEDSGTKGGNIVARFDCCWPLSCLGFYFRGAGNNILTTGSGKREKLSLAQDINARVAIQEEDTAGHCLKITFIFSY